MITDKEIEELAKIFIGFSVEKEWDAEEEYYNPKAMKYHSFIAGFKAAQSKLYSEEEVKTISLKAWAHGYMEAEISEDCVDKFFEPWWNKQIKK